jgi:hypothetical protein
VLANDIDTAWCGGYPARLAAVNMDESLDSVTGKIFECHR